MTFFVVGGWLLCLAGAFGMPAQPVPWTAGMALPAAAAAALWGWRGSLAVAFLSAVSCAGLILRGVPAGWLMGPLTLFAGLPALLAFEEGRRRSRSEELQGRRKAMERELQQLRESLEKESGSIRAQEEKISGISDLYGLSKQFLATLDREEALRITEEAMGKVMPQMGEKERVLFLDKVKSDLDQGDLSMESLVAALPAGGNGRDSWEKSGIIVGQLALGLKRVSLYRQVQESAIHDGLTGLLARRHFLERMAEELALAGRRKGSVVFLMVDLDHFKGINDAFGHLVGDLVLREAARLIQSSVREADLVGRYGGEEFAVVLPEAGLGLGVQIADRIREAIRREPISAYDEKVQVTVSVGVALYPEMASDADRLIELADEAMYRAKAQGRNRTITAERRGAG